MPTFELVFLLKRMDQAGLKSVLTRTAKYVLETGGNLRKMDNLGFRNTPLKIKGQREAHYFIFNYDAGIDQNNVIMDKFKRDLDVIKSRSFIESRIPRDHKEKVAKECTIWQDFLPPPERPSVLEILENTKQRNKHLERRKFKYNSGLNYDPL